MDHHPLVSLRQLQRLSSVYTVGLTVLSQRSPRSNSTQSRVCAQEIAQNSGRKKSRSEFLAFMKICISRLYFMWPHIHYIHLAAFGGFSFSVWGIIDDSYLRHDGTDFTLLFLSFFGTRKSEYHLFQVWPSLTLRVYLEKTIRFFISVVHRCNFHCRNIYLQYTEYNTAILQYWQKWLYF